jgi:hypothetical protein
MSRIVVLAVIASGTVAGLAGPLSSGASALGWHVNGFARGPGEPVVAPGYMELNILGERVHCNFATAGVTTANGFTTNGFAEGRCSEPAGFITTVPRGSRQPQGWSNTIEETEGRKVVKMAPTFWYVNPGVVEQEISATSSTGVSFTNGFKNGLHPSHVEGGFQTNTGGAELKESLTNLEIALITYE